MDEEGITNESNGAYPVRVLYAVGLQDGVLDESGAVSDSVDSSYIETNSNDDGTADYFEGTEAKTTVIERSGSLLSGYTEVQGGQLYLKAGSPRLGNLNDSIRQKTDNATGTAACEFYPTFEGEPSDGAFVIYLGNNGRLTAQPAASEETPPEEETPPGDETEEGQDGEQNGGSDTGQEENDPAIEADPVTPGSGSDNSGSSGSSGQGSSGSVDTGDDFQVLPYAAGACAAAGGLTALGAVLLKRRRAG